MISKIFSTGGFILIKAWSIGFYGEVVSCVLRWLNCSE